MKDDNKHAIDNAASWLSNIHDMVARLDEAVRNEPDKQDDIREEIQESPLAVEVRWGWHPPGEKDGGPEEYRILLTIGGPALRIIGELNPWNEPLTARLEWQDWGTPWTKFDTGSGDEKAMLTYAGEFYYAEE